MIIVENVRISEISKHGLDYAQPNKLLRFLLLSIVNIIFNLNRFSQVFALFLGVVFGVIPLSGVIAIVIYAAISTLAGQYFVCNYQGVSFIIFLWLLAGRYTRTVLNKFLYSLLPINGKRVVVANICLPEDVQYS